MPTRIQLDARVRAFIGRTRFGDRDEDALGELLAELAAYQRENVPAYGNLWRARGGDSPPAMPTDVFRHTRVAAFDEQPAERVFRTSGTTSGARGAHHFFDLSLYDMAAEAAARRWLFPDLRVGPPDAPGTGERIRLISVTPSEAAAPESSLSYMLSRFAEWVGDANTVWAFEGTRLDEDHLVEALRRAEDERVAVALLGTSFALVHVEERLAARGETFVLPERSRVMQTGGFKGRTRTLDADEMRMMLTERYGVADPFIVAEYGMTELSSQMYETTLRDALLGGSVGRRRLQAPGWVRVTAVDPETLAPTTTGEGLLRIDDAANLNTVCAIQTSDRGVVGDDGFTLLGRAPGATPRGCSLSVEEALGWEPR